MLMVACGGGHTLVVTEAGLHFAFGGGCGQLGLGGRDDRDVPVEVEGVGAPIVFAAAGDDHLGAVTSARVVFTWGEEPAVSWATAKRKNSGCRRSWRGSLMGARPAGREHTVVLTSNGELWGFVMRCSGQLGMGDTAGTLAPARAGAEALVERKVRMVACGGYHTVAVTEEGGLWAWGLGNHGQLGHNDMRNRLEPEQIGRSGSASPGSPPPPVD